MIYSLSFALHPIKYTTIEVVITDIRLTNRKENKPSSKLTETITGIMDDNEATTIIFIQTFFIKSTKDKLIMSLSIINLANKHSCDTIIATNKTVSEQNPNRNNI